MSDTPIAPESGAAALTGNPAGRLVGGVMSFGWSALAEGASGAPTPPLAHPLRQARFAVSGTFGADGAIAILGSRDAVNWTQLGLIASADAPGGGQLGSKCGDMTLLGAANGELVVAMTDSSEGEPVCYFRPEVQGGDGTTALAVTGQLSSDGAI